VKLSVQLELHGIRENWNYILIRISCQALSTAEIGSASVMGKGTCLVALGEFVSITLLNE
jgi:hypothetical protein